MAIAELFLNLHNYHATADFSESELDAIALLFSLNFDETGNQIKAILEKRYTDGISGFEGVAVSGSKITGIFFDIVSPSLTKKFNFTIDSDTGGVDYTQINTPAATPSFSEYEFAAPGSKSKQCAEGKSSACSRPDGSVYCIKIGYKCKSVGLSGEEKAVVKAIVEKGKGKSESPSPTKTSDPPTAKPKATKNKFAVADDDPFADTANTPTKKAKVKKEKVKPTPKDDTPDAEKEKIASKSDQKKPATAQRSLATIAKENDDVENEAHAAVKGKFKDLYGSLFGGEIDRLGIGSSALRTIKDGKWDATPEQQESMLTTLLQHSDRATIKPNNNFGGKVVSQDAADLANKLVERSMETAKELYAAASVEAKEKWAKRLLDGGMNSAADVADRGKNDTTKAIYKDLSDHAIGLMQKGEVPDFHDEASKKKPEIANKKASDSGSSPTAAPKTDVANVNKPLSADEKDEYAKELSKDPVRGYDFRQDVRRYQREYPNLPPEELAAITNYTRTTDYSYINSTLRGDDSGLKEVHQLNSSVDGDKRNLTQVKDRALKDTRMMVAAMERMPDFKGTVLRGTTIKNPAILDNYEVGKDVTEKGFTSTSTNKPYKNANVQFTIKSKTGKNIKEFSQHDQEEEVLFKPNTTFRVTKKELRDGVHHIEMEER